MPRRRPQNPCAGRARPEPAPRAPITPLPTRRLVAALAAGLGALCGCTSPRPATTLPEQLRQGRIAEAADKQANAFAPASIRVLPLTSLRTAGQGTPELELFVSAFDQYGHPTKGLGKLNVELWREAGTTVGDAVRLGTWLHDLSSPDANAAAYDRISLAYRLRLQGVPQNARGARLRVVVTLVGIGPDGLENRLKSEAILTGGPTPG